MPEADYYDTICSLRKAGYLQKVGFIGCYDDSMVSIESYNNAILAFAGTIRNISLVPYPKATRIAQGEVILDAYPVGERLEEFLCLTRLNVESPMDVSLCQLGQLLDVVAHSLDTLDIEMNETNARFDRSNEFGEACTRGQSFTRVIRVRIDEISLLTDQDMLFIMHRFPSVKHLTIICNDTQWTPRLDQLSSTKITRKFIAYILHFPCTFFGLTMSTKALMGAVSQLSASKSVTDLEVFTCSDINMKFPKLNLRNSKRGKNTSEISLVVKMPSSNIEPLYKHVIEGFSQSQLRLTLHGKPRDEHIFDEDRDFTALEKAQMTTFNESIDYILNNYQALKVLGLQKMILMPLSSSNTELSGARHLECLAIRFCQLHPQFLSQLSQRLLFITQMKISMVNWIQDDLAMLGIELGCTINMPFTEFGTILLDTHFTTHQPHLYKIWSSSKVVQFKFKAENTTHEFLTENEWNQSRRTMTDPWITMIYCGSCKFISIDRYTIQIDA